jgi:hypothetical protein
LDAREGAGEGSKMQGFATRSLQLGRAVGDYQRSL